MDEIQQQQNEGPSGNKRTPLRVVGYVSFLLSVICFVLHFALGSYYCFSKSIDVIVLALFLILAAIALFAFVKMKKKIWIVVLLLLVFLLFISAFSLQGPTPKGKDSNIRSDLNIIAAAQNAYFEDNDRYAITFDQLLDNYLSEQTTKNPYTKEVYALESDGNTWSVQSDLFSNKYELCGQLGAQDYLYRCSASSGAEAVCQDLEK